MVGEKDNEYFDWSMVLVNHSWSTALVSSLRAYNTQKCHWPRVGIWAIRAFPRALYKASTTCIYHSGFVLVAASPNVSLTLLGLVEYNNSLTVSTCVCLPEKRYVYSLGLAGAP